MAQDKGAKFKHGLCPDWRTGDSPRQKTSQAGTEQNKKAHQLGAAERTRTFTPCSART
jgi:hypothetical protein